MVLPLADAPEDGRRDKKDAIGHSSVPKQQNELLYGTVYYLYTITYSHSQIAPEDSYETPVDCKLTTAATIWKKRQDAPCKWTRYSCKNTKDWDRTKAGASSWRFPCQLTM